MEVKSGDADFLDVGRNLHAHSSSSASGNPSRKTLAKKAKAAVRKFKQWLLGLYSENVPLVKLALKLNAIVGFVVALWVMGISPLFLMGKLDMIGGAITLVAFFGVNFCAMPLIVALFGDWLHGKRKKVAEAQYTIPGVDEYTRLVETGEIRRGNS